MNKMTKFEKIYFSIMQIIVIFVFAFYTIGIEKLKYEYNWVIALILASIQLDIYFFNDNNF